jgi:hypothetical protein
MIDLLAFDALALSLHHSPGVHAILVGSVANHGSAFPTMASMPRSATTA